MFNFHRKKKHVLKWEIPEKRVLVPVKNIEKYLVEIKKKRAKFVSGGEFLDDIYAKEYGDGILAYFIIRTNKKTEEEKIYFDGYMLREEKYKVNSDVELTSIMSEDIEKMGYKEIFQREIEEWVFQKGFIKVSFFKIVDLGNFIEFALPATKVEETRELHEKMLKTLLKSLKISEKETIPTDAITFHYFAILQQQTGQNKKRGKKHSLF